MGKTRVSIRIDGKTISAATEFLRLILETANSNRSPQPPSTTNYDPYQLLGIPRAASAEQIRRRYHQLSRVFHPDKQGGTNEAMKRLNQAYDSICKERKLAQS